MVKTRGVDDPVEAVVLRGAGYEPTIEAPDGTVSLRNCPYHEPASNHRELTCGMNFAWAEGSWMDWARGPAPSSLRSLAVAAWCSTPLRWETEGEGRPIQPTRNLRKESKRNVPELWLFAGPRRYGQA